MKELITGPTTRDIMKWLWLATIVTAFLGPLLAFNIAPGLFLHRILFFVSMTLFVILVYNGRLSPEGMTAIKPYLIFFTMWLVWAAVSLIWCNSKMDGLRNVWYLFSGISIIYFTVFYFRAESDLKALQYGLIAIFIVVLLAGLWQCKTGLHFKTAGYIHEANMLSKVPRGFFKNPNDLATYLVLYMPLVYVTARYFMGRVATAPLALILTTSLGVGIYLLINTGSRANMLAFGIMVIAAVALYLVQYRLRALRNIIIVVTSFMLLYYAVASLYPGFDYHSKRQYRIAKHHLSSLEHIGTEHSARVILTRNALDVLKDHFFTGVGAGNAEQHMKKYRTDDFLILALHNWWLELLVNYGLFMFLLYIWFYLKLFHDLFKVFIRAGPGLVRTLAEYALIVLAAFPIAATSSSSLMYNRPMWIFFALAICVVNMYFCTRPQNGSRLIR